MARLKLLPEVKYSYELYDYNLLFIRWMADFCGMDMMVENYKINYRTVRTVVVLLFAIASTVYSAIIYFPNFYKIVELLMAFGITVQSAAKFSIGYFHWPFYKMMYNKLRLLHFINRDHARNSQTLLLLIQRIHLASKAIAAIYSMAFVVFNMYPLLWFWIMHEKVLSLAFIIPGLSTEASYGYGITLIVHAFLIFLAVTGLVAADTVILLFVTSVSGYADLLRNELDDLNELLDSADYDRKIISEKVRRICCMHQEVIQYESDLDDRYINTCFVQVVTSVTSISAALFLIYTKNHIPSYGLLPASLFQLLEFCLLGTVLTVKNQEIMESIYDAHWYKLPKEEQRCFELMLHKSQNTIEMTIGGLAPLNIETFVGIINRIYSYFMMLINFIED
ncbi:odorant receptor 67d-like [Uranotaenia lowii]|uniref:odorant receptor 67d-like n=1 Tax=Uranotaenia lowii TaxID=190385 RepID=UPI00247933D5|nr:odorant receptor 67d-like [Uranotaenia lowii]